MKQIFTYPNNLSTQYIDPDYIGDLDSGLRTRIKELLEGNYLSWKNIDPISDLATSQNEAMRELSKFINYMDAEKEYNNLTFYDFWRNPVVVATKKLIGSEDIISGDVDTTAATITTDLNHSFTTGDIVTMSNMNNSWTTLNQTDYYAEVTGADTLQLRVGATDGPFVRFYNLADADTSNTSIDPVDDAILFTVDDASEFSTGLLSNFSNFNGTVSRWNDMDFYAIPVDSTTLKFSWDVSGTDLLKLVNDPDEPVNKILDQVSDFYNDKIKVVLPKQYDDKTFANFDGSSTIRHQNALHDLGQLYLGEHSTYLPTGDHLYTLFHDEALTTPVVLANLYSEPYTNYTVNPDYTVVDTFGEENGYEVNGILQKEGMNSYTASPGDQYSAGGNDVYRYEIDYANNQIKIPSLIGSVNKKITMQKLVDMNPAIALYGTDPGSTYNLYNVAGVGSTVNGQKGFWKGTIGHVNPSTGVLYNDAGYVNKTTLEGWAFEIGYCNHVNSWGVRAVDQTAILDDSNSIVLNDQDGTHWGYFTFKNTTDEAHILAYQNDFIYKDVNWKRDISNQNNFGPTEKWFRYETMWNSIIDTGFFYNNKRLFKFIDPNTGIKKPALAIITDEVSYNENSVTSAYPQYAKDFTTNADPYPDGGNYGNVVRFYPGDPLFDVFYDDKDLTFVRRRAMYAGSLAVADLQNPTGTYYYGEYQTHTITTPPVGDPYVSSVDITVRTMQPNGDTGTLVLGTDLLDVGTDLCLTRQIIDVDGLNVTKLGFISTWNEIGSVPSGGAGYSPYEYVYIDVAPHSGGYPGWEQYWISPNDFSLCYKFVTKSDFVDCVTLAGGAGSTVDIGETLYASTQGHIVEAKTPDDAGQVLLEDLSAADTGQIALSSSEPYRYELDLVRIVLPGNKSYSYLDQNGVRQYLCRVRPWQYWSAGESRARYPNVTGETIPNFDVTVDSNGYLDTLALSSGQDPRGRFVDGDDILFPLESYSDDYYPPAPTPAEQQDIWDTDDEWLETGYDQRKVWPNHVSPSSAEIVYNAPTIVNNSQSGVKYTRSVGHTKWKLNVEYPAMTKSDFQIFHAIAQAARGQAIPFYFKLRNKLNQNILWGDFADKTTTNVTPILREDALAGDTTMLLEGFASFESNPMVKGEVFIGSENQNGQLHTVLNNPTQANVFGEAKIRIPWPLRQAMYTSNKIYKDPFWAIVTLADDAFTYNIDTAGYYYVSVQFDLDGWK